MHHEDKCNKSAICKRCGEDGSDHPEFSCEREMKCANCKGHHSADSKLCGVWKREKEIMRVKYTQNISFPEARKLVENALSTPSYSAVTQKTMSATNAHECHTCKLLMDRLSKITPDELPSFVKDFKPSLNKTRSNESLDPSSSKQSTNTIASQSESTSQSSSQTSSQSSSQSSHSRTTRDQSSQSSQAHAKSSRGEATKKAPQPQRERPSKIPARQDAPAGQERQKQRSAPRQKVQLEPPQIHSHNRYEVLEEMDTLDRGPAPPKSSKCKPNS